MIHERSDYNKRIQDSDNIIPEDEPVFLLRAQDEDAIVALFAYADTRAKKYGKHDEIAKGVYRQIKFFRE